MTGTVIRKNNNRMKLTFIMAIVLLCSMIALFDLAVALVFASNESESETLHRADVDFLTEDEDAQDCFDITYPFLDTSDVVYEWSFPYSDEFFRIPSDRFSMKTAQGSLGLAASAFRSTTKDMQYETYLTEAGFEKLYAFGYDEETTTDSLNGVIGMKQIDDFTVIAAVTCGQGYGKEWAGNLKIGTGSRHQGFNEASKLLREYINTYVKDNEIEGHKKLWLAGLSRAAAIANLAAADLIDSGEYDDIYAYLFGVPGTTKEPETLSGIYNMCGQYDPVAFAPLESWGFKRNGTDLFTPAQEADADYPALAHAASGIREELADKKFRNNPGLNYQLRLLLQAMGEFFPTSEDYAERLQDIIMELWSTEGFENAGSILQEALLQLDPEGKDEKSSIHILVEYISYIAGQHTRLDQQQIYDGSWDPEEPLEANLILEHRPATYVSWLFADKTPQELLADTVEGRRICLQGDIDVEVSKDGIVLAAMDRKGNVSYPDPPEGSEGSDGKGLTEPFMMRSGKESEMSLPAGDDYQITIHNHHSGLLTYYDFTMTAQHLMGQPGSMNAVRLSKGDYLLDITGGEKLSSLTDLNGRSLRLISQEYDYSPVMLMSGELQVTGSEYLTLGSAIRVVLITAGAILLLLIICLVIFLVHWRRRRKGHPPYSNLYVIVPHFALIVIFAALTSFSTKYLYAMEDIRAICAAATIGVVFLLAFRAFSRNRRKLNALFALIILLLIPVAYLYYGSDLIRGHSLISFIISVVSLIVVSVIVSCGFRTCGFKRSGEE